MEDEEPGPLIKTALQAAFSVAKALHENGCDEQDCHRMAIYVCTKILSMLYPMVSHEKLFEGLECNFSSMKMNAELCEELDCARQLMLNEIKNEMS